MIFASLRLFFFNNTAPPAFYTLSLHDALPIFPAVVPRDEGTCGRGVLHDDGVLDLDRRGGRVVAHAGGGLERSEEHTSELQSHSDLVCRLLLEKKKKT